MKYEHKDTILHHISPAIKILYSIAVSILIVILNKPYQLGLLTLSVLLIFSLAKPALRQLRPLIFVIIAIVVTTSFSQGVFYYFNPKTPLLTIVPEQFPIIGWLTKGIYIYKEGIIYGIIQSLRIIIATFMAATIVLTTHYADMITTLNKIKFPRSFSFVISVSIRFFPQILEEVRRVILALRLRGLKIRGISRSFKAMRFVLVPLVINSLRQARSVALAAEVRGFSADTFCGDYKRKERLFRFNTLELITIAFFIVLMYIAILPFKMGLSKVPFLHSFFFSIPFTCVLFMGIRLIPKFGTTTFLICGHSLFAQIISRGINPLWWPYALIESLALEIYFLLTKNYLRNTFSAISSGALRGLVVYLYFYFVSSPLIWHKFYATWYITIQTIQGVIGSSLGGMFGYKISKIVERAYKYGGL